MKKILKLIQPVCVVMLLTLGIGYSVPNTAVALTQAATDACQGIEAVGGNCNTAGDDSELLQIVETIINLLSIAVGVASVIMIIIGGFRYIISAGDSNGIQGAKNTILYALVGLVVALFAQVIVVFVIDRTDDAAGPSSTTGTPAVAQPPASSSNGISN